MEKRKKSLRSVLNDESRIRRFMAQVENPSYVAKFLSRGLVVLFILSLGLIFIPWVQTSYVKGKVIGFSHSERVFEIQAPIEGRLKQWFVKEGEQVAKGQLLLELADNDQEIIERLKMKLIAIEAQLSAMDQNVKTAQLNVNRQSRLLKEGLASQLDVEKTKISLKNQKAKKAKVETEEQKVRIMLSRQNQLKVYAPNDGVVVRILKTSVGGSQYIKNGEVLATLAPTVQQKAVEFWIEGNDIPLIHVGQEVRMQFEGWPAIQFSGWPEASFGTFLGEVKVIDALSDQGGKFRALILPKDGEVWPPDQRLRQGTLVIGWVLLGEVSLGYEFWRQMNKFPKDYVGPAHHKEQTKTSSKKSSSKGKYK